MVAKEHDQVDHITSDEERFIGRDGGGYSAKSRGADEDRWEKKRTICINLWSRGERRRMYTCSRNIELNKAITNGKW